MVQPNRITLITLAVSDPAVSRRYYEALGWQEAEGGNENIAFYALRGQFFGLYRREALAQNLGQAVQRPATGAVTLAQNFSSTGEVDQAHADALVAGAREVTSPETTHWGGYSGYVADPDGHLWEFAYNPFWELDDTGLVKGQP